jgi:hypothetical protein
VTHRSQRLLGPEIELAGLLLEEAVQPDQGDSLLVCPPLELRREAAGKDRQLGRGGTADGVAVCE